MSQAQPESDAVKIARYRKQNGTNTLTDKQVKRLQNPAKYLREQHQQNQVIDTMREPTRIGQDELVDFIKNAPADWGGGTYRIDSTHTDAEKVHKDLSSARSRIGRYVRKLGLQYSTQILTDAQGDPYLSVHVEI